MYQNCVYLFTFIKSSTEISVLSIILQKFRHYGISIVANKILHSLRNDDKTNKTYVIFLDITTHRRSLAFFLCHHMVITSTKEAYEQTNSNNLLLS